MKTTSNNPLDRHRGPFVLMAYAVNKEGGTRKLATESDRREVARLAQSFLSDPRDNVHSVAVFSQTENAHVVTFRPNGPEMRLALDEPDIIDQTDSEPVIQLRDDTPAESVTETPATIEPEPAQPAPEPAKTPKAPKSRKTDADRAAKQENRQSCPYSGTKGLDRTEQTCPMCGHVATPAPMGGSKGKPGAIRFPYHKRMNPTA